MKNNFDTAFYMLMKIEGGLVDDKRDKGGLTKYGISQKAFPNLKIVDITLDQAKEIYRKHYWDACQCDDLPPSFDIAVFDSAVNQGPKPAVLMLQKALKIKDDGIIGEKTINACKAAGEAELRVFLLHRLFRYFQSSDFDHFGQGWFNRLVTVSEAI